MSEKLNLQTIQKQATFRVDTAGNPIVEIPAALFEALFQKLRETETFKIALQQFIHDVSDGMECLPSCHRQVHDPLCPVVHYMGAWRSLRAKGDALAAALSDFCWNEPDPKIMQDSEQQRWQAARTALWQWTG